MKEGSGIRTSVRDLPGDIIDDILWQWNLSLRDAVRAGAVCREWRDKWKSLPRVVIDADFDDEKLVDHVLPQHHRNIHIFSIRSSRRHGPHAVNRWVDALVPHSAVLFFALHYPFNLMPPTSKYYLELGSVVPPSFFSFKTLRRITLSFCLFPLPPLFTGFSRLIILYFESVSVAPADLERLVSRSPLLQTLTLLHCRLLSFQLEAPRLSYFRFDGRFENIRFTNSPLLARVYFAGGCLLRDVSFHLLPPPHPHALQFSDAGLSRIPWPDKQLLQLSLYLDSVNEIDCALRSARLTPPPHLHKLRVSFKFKFKFCGAAYIEIEEEEEAVMQFLRAQKTPDHHLNHLRKVEIADFCATEPQIELLRYLLASAAGLKELLVLSPPSSATISDWGLMDMLKQFPHASPIVQLIVERRHGRMRICYISS